MTKTDKIFWALWLAAVLLLVWLALPSFGDTPPLPPGPVITVNIGQGAGARALLRRHPKTGPRVVTYAWRYASEYTNVWFNLEASADLKNWVCIRSNASGDLWVTNSGERFRGFRLKGRFTP